MFVRTRDLTCLKLTHKHTWTIKWRFLPTDNKDIFEYSVLLYITSDNRCFYAPPSHSCCDDLWWSVLCVCVCVCVSLYVDRNKGCLAKRKCQGGNAWLIRYRGRIMYEQSSWRESEQERKREAAIVLSLLSPCCLSPLPPPPPPLLSPLPVSSLCVCAWGYLGSLVTLCLVFWCRAATPWVYTIYS